MIAVARFFSILHVSVCAPFRYLAGKTHEFAEYNWGPRSMGRAMDILLDASQNISEDVRLIHNKDFMMHIFDEISD